MTDEIDPTYWNERGLEAPVRVNRWAAFTDVELACLDISDSAFTSGRGETADRLGKELWAEQERRGL